MALLRIILIAEVWVFLAAVIAVVLHRLASGAIDLGDASFHRLQFMAVSLAFAAYYVTLSVTGAGQNSLPDPGPSLTFGFGASSFTYLINKLLNLWPPLRS